VYRTLFHIPLQVGSVPILGFGVLLAVWTVLSVVVLVWLVRKYGLASDTLGNIPLLVLVGAIIWFVLPRMCDEQGLPVRSYGVMMLTAVLCATGLVAWRLQRRRLNPELAVSLALWVVVPGVIGARLFYVIEYWETQFRPAFVSEHGGLLVGLAGVINVARGGLVVYGGLIGAVVGLLAFVRSSRLPLWAVCDLVAPALALGLALGRIGCLLNGCCFGGVCHHAWAITFPPNSPAYEVQAARGLFWGFRLGTSADGRPMVAEVTAGSPAARAGLKQGDLVERIGKLAVNTRADAQRLVLEAFEHGRALELKPAGRPAVKLGAIKPPPRSLPVHPSQLYSTINALLLCLLLLAAEPFLRRDGQLFALLLTIYPVARFLIEIIRDDELPVWITGLTISQNVSLLVFCGAMALWAYLARRPPEKAWG